MQNTILLRLFGGEMLIGETEPGYEDFFLENPRLVHTIPTMDGNIGMVLRPVCDPFDVERLKKSISIPRSQVMFTLSEDEIEKGILDGYRSDVSGIKIASLEEAAAINSAGNFQI